MRDKIRQIRNNVQELCKLVMKKVEEAKSVHDIGISPVWVMDTAKDLIEEIDLYNPEILEDYLVFKDRDIRNLLFFGDDETFLIGYTILQQKLNDGEDRTNTE